MLRENLPKSIKLSGSLYNQSLQKIFDSVDHSVLSFDDEFEVIHYKGNNFFETLMILSRLAKKVILNLSEYKTFGSISNREIQEYQKSITEDLSIYSHMN